MILYEKLKKVLNATSTCNRKENFIDLFERITGDELVDSIQYSGSLEKFFVDEFCKYEKESIEKKIPIKKGNSNIPLNKEKNIFAKLFIRDYIKNVGLRYDLCIPYNLSATVLFRDFASEELKSDREFVETILKLDGRFLSYMNSEFKNDPNLFEIALQTDTSKYMESFLKTKSELRKNPNLALLFFKGLVTNNNTLSADTICRVFLAKGMLERYEMSLDQEMEGKTFEGNESTSNPYYVKVDGKIECVGENQSTVVMINGQIEWIGKSPLDKLSNVFSEEEFRSWLSSTEFLVGLVKINARFGAHITKNILSLPTVVLNNDTQDKPKQKLKK